MACSPIGRTSRSSVPTAAGDIGAGDVVDWLTAWARFENSALYLAFRTQGNIDFAQNAWRYGVLPRYRFGLIHGLPRRRLGVCARRRVSRRGRDRLQVCGQGADWTWSRVAGSATYAIAGNRLEMRIAASMIGMTSKSKIKIMLVGKNDGTYDFARDDKAGFAYPRDPIVVDGAFTDWAAVTPVGTDATGDVSPSDIVDWLDLRALGQNGTLYLSYTTAKPIDLANNGSRYDVLIDADNNNRSGYTNIPGGIGAEFLIEGATLFKYAGDGATWQWTPVTRVGAAVAANRLELAVAASHLGLSDTQFNIRLRLLGNNTGDLGPGPGSRPRLQLQAFGSDIACKLSAHGDPILLHQHRALGPGDLARSADADHADQSDQRTRRGATRRSCRPRCKGQRCGHDSPRVRFHWIQRPRSGARQARYRPVCGVVQRLWTAFSSMRYRYTVAFISIIRISIIISAPS